ncbi:MAG: D-2-hydroxyacid dehydrogenase [Myxococcales bacterium]|nr:D-2-hydroxyacid dehydrogenase [Myxococcales bacterium]
MPGGLRMMGGQGRSEATAGRPRIVVLDAHTLNPGDLSWQGLAALGDTTIHDRSAPEQVLERAAGASVVLTNKTPLKGELLSALSALRYVGVLATGHDVVDAAAAAEGGIVVCNVPAYSTASVAQHTFALLLELTNHAALHGEAASAGRWTASGEFSLYERPMLELAGLRLGLVGLGRIGQAVARLGQAFGMELLAHSSKLSAPGGLPIALVSLEQLFAESDVLSLHCPLTAATAGLVNAERLASMKPTALLINTARGGLVDSAALARALLAGQLAGAALDVLEQEPPPRDHPLLTSPRCLVTPHIGWATRAARGRLLQVAVDNVRAFLAGAPQNVVAGG